MSNEYLDYKADELLTKATAFAICYHHGQKRKYTGEDYIVHPTEVSQKMHDYLIKKYDKVPYEAFSRMIIATIMSVAFLHDTVEDTEATLEDIEKEFGKQVKDLVYWLTNVSKPEDGNRKIRKQKDLEHILSAPITAICIKIADVICNCKGMVELDRKYSDGEFCKRYIKEKLQFLHELEKIAKKPTEDYMFQVFLSMLEELREVLETEKNLLDK